MFTTVNNYSIDRFYLIHVVSMYTSYLVYLRYNYGGVSHVGHFTSSHVGGQKHIICNLVVVPHRPMREIFIRQLE